jgi:hypothetical protein
MVNHQMISRLLSIVSPKHSRPHRWAFPPDGKPLSLVHFDTVSRHWF